MTIRMLILGASMLFRQALRSLLEDVDDVDLAAEADLDVEHARAAFDATRPDVVVLHIGTQPTEPPGSARLPLALCGPTPTVLLMPPTNPRVDLPMVIRAGVTGYVAEEDDATELLRAVRHVAGGGAWISPAYAHQFLTHYRENTVERQLPERSKLVLSERECGVVRLIAQGRSNSEIARELTLAESTVKTHVSRTLRKLNLRDRTQLARYAYENLLV